MSSSLTLNNSGNYRKAFLACRKHRIDLSFIIEHDCVKFLEDIPSFVEQVHEVDHINLFLTGIGCVHRCRLASALIPCCYSRGSQPPETITRLCDAIRVELEKKDLAKYVNSVLTAHLVKTPPDHEAGLGLLLRLRGKTLNVFASALA
jgi:elongator complex protein 1